MKRYFVKMRLRAVFAGLSLWVAACSASYDDDNLSVTRSALVTGNGNLVPGVSFNLTPGTVSLVESAALTSARFVTAAKVGTASSGALRVALWRLNDNQTFSSLHVFTSASTVSNKVSVARLDDQHFLVAARNGSGNLEVTAFAIDSSNVISQTSRVAAGAISDVKVVATNMSPGSFPFGSPTGPAGEPHAVVIYRASNTALALKDYSIDAQGALRGNGSATAGGVAYVSGTYVSGTQPPAAWFSRSGVATEQSALACSDATDNDGDKYVDCDDFDCCGNSVCSSSSVCTQGMVVTATPNNVSNMKLVSWRVSANGSITRQKELGSERSLGIDATPLSFRRFATIRTHEGFPVLQTWDVTDDAGTMALHASFTIPFNTTRARVVNGGGTRLWTQLTDPVGDGILHTFDAADTITVGDLTSLFTRTWNNSPSIVSLSQDHVAVTNFSTTNTLVARSYRDFRQPLLKGSFTFSNPNGATPQTNQNPFNFDPGLRLGGDAAIAVSPSFMLACGNGSTVIYDKAGNLLQSALSHALSSKTRETLFDAVLSRTLASGADNQQSISRHLVHQHLCDPRFESSAQDGKRNSCPDDGFDTDCTFDETLQRFVVTSIIRYFGSAHATKDKMQRYVAVAVSKTADPRQGFNVYMTTDNKYDDNPMMASNGGFITLTHQADDQDLADTYPNESLSPSALVFDVASMTDPPAARLAPTKIASWQTDGNYRMNVVNVRGPRTLNALYKHSSSLGGYRLFTFQRLAEGPVRVFTDTSTDVAQVPSGPGNNYATNGWLQLNSLGDGEFYVSDHYTASDGTERVRVTGANFFAGYDANRVLQEMNLIAFGPPGEAHGCGGSFSCQNPSMARTVDSTYLVYQRYRNDYRQCPAGVACASGICVSSTCQSNPIKPSVYFTRFDRFLSRFGSAPSLVAPGDTVMADANGPIWTRNSPNVEHSAAMGDFGLNSVWFINVVPIGGQWVFRTGHFR